ncbi:expressed protein [Chlorella variabilis]|uniref:Expressed protein n=1 Tax=Chlorella variabilis TaxID=554065 RepID=E1ZEK7_CHLVA|nr:expressed protein [Chlorella variabilis]EFN55679.1 expressed protein [Chlorella variabilis]|eukprot:XP_005847781.1 expressed protein [Chlorella variabilis]
MTAVSFLTLPGSLPFLECSEHSDFDDLLTVPQHNDFSLSSSSSLDATEFFLGEIGSAEATSSVSIAPASPASSRLQELTSSFPLALDDLERAQQQLEPVPAPLPLGLHGLKLKLDFGSVMSAWHSVGGGAHPFHMTGPALSAVTAAIPSATDLEASLAAASVPAMGASPAGSTAEPAGPSSTAAATAAAAEASRMRDRKASRKSSERKLVYPARKVSADKRPRIKGRFVTKAEFELMAPPRVSHDRLVPGLVRA